MSLLRCELTTFAVCVYLEMRFLFSLYLYAVADRRCRINSLKLISNMHAAALRFSIDYNTAVESTPVFKSYGWLINQGLCYFMYAFWIRHVHVRVCFSLACDGGTLLLALITASCSWRHQSCVSFLTTSPPPRTAALQAALLLWFACFLRLCVSLCVASRQGRWRRDVTASERHQRQQKLATR